jgi:hypothetical protein
MGDRADPRYRHRRHRADRVDRVDLTHQIATRTAEFDIWRRHLTRCSPMGVSRRAGRDAREALRRAKRAVLRCLPEEMHDAAAEAFSSLHSMLAAHEGPPPIEPGAWAIRSIDSFQPDELERTPQDKWYCPLCAAAFWGRQALAKHLRNPHGICPEPGCGQVVLASGLASHRYSRHERPRNNAPALRLSGDC